MENSITTIKGDRLQREPLPGDKVTTGSGKIVYAVVDKIHDSTPTFHGYKFRIRDQRGRMRLAEFKHLYSVHGGTQ